MLEPFFPGCSAPDAAQKLIAVCAISFLAVINSLKVEYGTRIQNIFTILKLISLGAIIVGGLVMMCFGHFDNLKDGFSGSTTSPVEISLALYSGMFSYGGWYTLNFLTEEMKDANK